MLPGNPILVRVVSGGSKRLRHFYIRLGYLIALFVVMLVKVIGQGSEGTSLGELAKIYSQSLQNISIAQLALMCFLSPVFAAAAITQERDARTYDILLTTPMSNAQIVLGALMSRLYFIIVLLLSGLPIACITMIYGGVTAPIIFKSFAVAAGTAIFTGSLAIAISVIQVGTRRTVFSFYLFIGVYLAAVGFLSTLTKFQVPEAPAPTVENLPAMSFLAPFHPFLALFTALNMVPAPAAAEVVHYGWPMSSLLANPTRGFVVLTLLGSVVLVAGCVFFVRHGARLGERTLRDRLQFWRKELVGGELRQKPRRVWQNPVAWREAATRASVTSRSLLRYLFVGGGTLAGAVLFLAYVTGSWGLSASSARDWLTGLIFIEFATILLVATNVAATSISREREAQTLELLLSTPLTSRYIIWGKLRGLVSFTLPLICVPVLTCALFSLHALLPRGPRQAIVYPETAVLLAVLMIVFSACACMLGIYRSLMSRTTLHAVLTAIGILVLVCGGATMCGLQIVNNGNPAAAVFAPFTPFTTIFVAINPEYWMGFGAQASSATLGQFRIWALAGSILAAGIYSVVVHAAYRAMVRNFDMTIRKQSV